MHEDAWWESIARLDGEERAEYLRSLDARQLRSGEFDWHSWARPPQLPPEGDWAVWLIMAGRGFGKTRAGAEWVRAIAEADGAARFALVAANFGEARSVMVEGESGLLQIAPPGNRPQWEPSLKRLRWDNGASATLYSAAEPEGLRGPQHSHAHWAGTEGIVSQRSADGVGLSRPTKCGGGRVRSGPTGSGAGNGLACGT